jgi:tetratricopeptide (TPR) repeat protein
MTARDGDAPDAAPAGDADALLAEARAHHQAGRLFEAEQHYRRALEVRPADAQALSRLGAALAGQGKLVEAAGVLERALEIDSDLIEALNNIGIVYQMQGKADEAAAAYGRVIDIAPGHLMAHVNMGALLHRLGRNDEARRAYQRALAIDPGFAEAHNGLGVALAGLGDPADAAAAFRRALEIDPGHAEAMNNLGNVLKRQDDLAGAVDVYRRAIAARPRLVEAHVNLGNALRSLGQVAAAADALTDAVGLDRENAEAHWGLAQALLVQGRFAEGWPEYAWRARIREFAGQTWSHGRPRWDGQPLAAKTILLDADHDVADAIQFIRYVPRVAALVSRVVVKCPESLIGLFRSVNGIRVAGPDVDKRKRFDVEAPLISLPGLFGTDEASIPDTVPYMAPPPGGPALDLPAGDGLTVGLAWAGDGGGRAIDLGLLTPLLDIPGCRFVALETATGTGDVMARGLVGRIREFGDLAGDLVGVAWVMQHLDLVIAADGALAHLAGALGRPVWTLLPFAPDWRWLLDRASSPWYPTMRLYRQQTAGDWAGVVDRVAADLRKRLAH